MPTLTYTAELRFNKPEDKLALLEFLGVERDVFNFASAKHFGAAKNSIIELHAKVYRKARKQFPKAKAQLVCKAEYACLAAYRSAKANGHKLEKPAEKKRLAMIFDKRLSTYKDGVFHLSTCGRRVEAHLVMYERLADALEKSGNTFGDTTVFVRGDRVFINIPIKIGCEEVKPTLALGVDLGIRRAAATSEGVLFIDKAFNKRKRKLRYLKRMLQSRKTSSARHHLKKVGRKERNINKNFTHHLANAIIASTDANTLVLEDLNCKTMKAKKHFAQKKNRISQVSFAKLRFILAYKAGLHNKAVVCVNPAYTSQTDHVTGRRKGLRQGCRFYTVKHGIVYDADVNAAVNIAKLAELPVSCRRVLDGQAIVSKPIVPV